MLIQKGDLIGMLFLWHRSVEMLSHNGSRDNAVLVGEGFGSVLMLGIDAAGPATFAIFPKNEVVADAATWGNVVCGQLAFALRAIDNSGTAPSSLLIRPYAQAVQDAMIWGPLMQDFNDLVGQLNFPASVPCPAFQPDIAAPVRATFPNFLTGVTKGLGLPDPVTDLSQIVTARLKELVTLAAALQGANLDPESNQVAGLIADQFRRVRHGAHDDCRLN